MSLLIEMVSCPRLDCRRAAAAVAIMAMMASWPAQAQLFGQPQQAQPVESDSYLRVERLEKELRQITGQIEELQHRNRQLEQQLRRLQEDYDYRFQQLGGAGARSAPAQPAPPPPPSSALPPPPPSVAAPPAIAPPPVAPPASAGRRGDAFDPAANPSAPGVPRALGSGQRLPAQDTPDVGVPGGRAPGDPLDLSRGTPRADNAATPLPPPPPSHVSATGAMPTVPPSQTPKDEFDLGYGYVMRKDYALGEQTLRAFLKKYPTDPLAADAQYWLGESQFQRQRFRDAAESFLTLTTKYETASKAPDALLRLGQSLAALKEKEAACAAYGEALRKHPRASTTIRQSVEREQKRIGC